MSSAQGFSVDRIDDLGLAKFYINPHFSAKKKTPNSKGAKTIFTAGNTADIFYTLSPNL